MLVEVVISWIFPWYRLLVVDVCKVVKMKERPFRTEDYSLKLHPVWYHEATGSSVIEDPRQLAIDTSLLSGNIFVADYSTKKNTSSL